MPTPEPRTFALSPFNRARLLLVLLGVSVLVAGFMWFAVDRGQAIGTIGVLVAASLALTRFAVPSQRARELTLGAEELVIRRASPVVTTIGWGELTAARLVTDADRAELELVPADPNTFRCRHPEVRGPQQNGPRWRRLVDRTLQGVPYDLRRIPLAAGDHAALAAALDERFDDVSPA